MEKFCQERKGVRCTTSINLKKSEHLSCLHSFEQLSSNICAEETRRLEFVFDTNYSLLFETPRKSILTNTSVSAGWQLWP